MTTAAEQGVSTEWTSVNKSLTQSGFLYQCPNCRVYTFPEKVIGVLTY